MIKVGDRIISEYQGVYYKTRPNGNPCWCAKYQKKGKSKFLGHFEFSDKGEMLARQAYQKYLLEINEQERHSVKRIYEFKK